MYKSWQPIRQFGLIFSLLAITASVFLLVKFGMSLGLDFTGGHIIDFTVHNIKSEQVLTNKLNQLTQSPFALQNISEGHWRVIFSSDVQGKAVSQFTSALTTATDAHILESKFLGSQVGEELKTSGALAAVFAIVSVLIYLIVRFEWRLALAATIALFHDVLITLAWFSYSQTSFDLTVLAAILAIIGYSLNDSIIIGDRVREVIRANPTQAVSDSINIALHSTLRRTLITSLTTLATVFALWLLGGEALNGFATALLIGLTAGTLSSIFISATLPQFMGLEFANYENQDSEEVKRRLAEP